MNPERYKKITENENEKNVTTASAEINQNLIPVNLNAKERRKMEHYKRINNK